MPIHVAFPPNGLLPVVAWSGPLPKDTQLPAHSGQAMVLFCFDGLMRVEVDEDRWFIPDRYGIWIPAGTVPRVKTSDDIEFQAFQLHPKFDARIAMPQQPTVLRATPLIRGIARRLTQPAPLTVAQQRRLGWVALDEIARLERPNLHLPGSDDARVSAVMAHVMADPRRAASLSQLARTIGSSERTLSRLFLTETGMTWRDWRDRLRFVLSLEGLQAGKGSTDIAVSLGYSSPSAFVAAFRRQSGMTPTEWRHQR
ncbi:helix-turn-helix domain-containing protein [Pseudorhodobacter aquimaris]|uniref:helix-turn-helix domain-containing protein n=1 Tax=Pseudorhodobacter aquimaris TaxID=687412 RepID=UPI0009F9EC27|nr:AraC family transcriptional regulator [Pseudorhodobacter aquimaris]